MSVINNAVRTVVTASAWAHANAARAAAMPELINALSIVEKFSVNVNDEQVAFAEASFAKDASASEKKALNAAFDTAVRYEQDITAWAGATKFVNPVKRA